MLPSLSLDYPPLTDTEVGFAQWSDSSVKSRFSDRKPRTVLPYACPYLATTESLNVLIGSAMHVPSMVQPFLNPPLHPFRTRQGCRGRQMIRYLWVMVSTCDKVSRWPASSNNDPNPAMLAGLFFWVSSRLA